MKSARFKHFHIRDLFAAYSIALTRKAKGNKSLAITLRTENSDYRRVISHLLGKRPEYCTLEMAEACKIDLRQQHPFLAKIKPHRLPKRKPKEALKKYRQRLTLWAEARSALLIKKQIIDQDHRLPVKSLTMSQRTRILSELKR